jgi:hypothetical protein
MPADPLAIYLNDHLAGSVVALELIETLCAHEQGRPRETTLASLAADIAHDQETLRAILARLGGDESRVKQAAAWLSEKLGRVKLALGAHDHAPLGMLEGLETLGLGIQGKAALWRALAAIAPEEPRLEGYQFSMLEARAVAQHDTVERERLAAVAAAFGHRSAGTRG